MRALVRPESEGLKLDVMGSRIWIRVRSEETGGAFSVVEMQVPGGFQAPPTPHRHTDVDWYALVDDGELAIELDGVVRRAGQRGIVVVPRGVAFRWWNFSQDHGLRWLATYTPGGFERFFLDMNERLQSLGRPPAPSDMAAIAMPLWGKYHVETLPPES